MAMVGVTIVSISGQSWQLVDAKDPSRGAGLYFTFRNLHSEPVTFFVRLFVEQGYKGA
jgi:hypothetical protein